MTITRHLIFLLAAVVCFAVGFLIGIDVFGGDTIPWLFGGLALFAAAHLP